MSNKLSDLLIMIYGLNFLPNLLSAEKKNVSYKAFPVVIKFL